MENLWVCVSAFLSEAVWSFGEILTVSQSHCFSSQSTRQGWAVVPSDIRSTLTAPGLMTRKKSLDDLSLVLFQPLYNLLNESDVNICYSLLHSNLYLIHYSWVISYMPCVWVGVGVYVCQQWHSQQTLWWSVTNQDQKISPKALSFGEECSCSCTLKHLQTGLFFFKKINWKFKFIVWILFGGGMSKGFRLFFFRLWVLQYHWFSYSMWFCLQSWRVPKMFRF